MRIERGEFFCRGALLRGRGAIGRADGRAGRGQREEVPVRCGAESVVWWDGRGCGWAGGRERSMCNEAVGGGAAAMRESDGYRCCLLG